MGMSEERGYELVRVYVEYYWRTGKFYSLKNENDMEDIIGDIYIKFLEKSYFKKYNSKVTSDKYYIMNGVRTSMIDMLRKYRQKISLDAEDEDGITMMDRINSNEHVEENVIGDTACEEVLKFLSDETNSKVEGHSPLLGDCKMTHRAIALHLAQGYSVKEIASFFINPNNHKPVSNGRVHQLIKEIRERLS